MTPAEISQTLKEDSLNEVRLKEEELAVGRQELAGGGRGVNV